MSKQEQGVIKHTDYENRHLLKIKTEKDSGKVIRVCKKKFTLIKLRSWARSHLLVCLPSVQETLGLIPRTTSTKRGGTSL